MVLNCGACLSALTRTRPGVSCDGCKKEYHSVCITKNENLVDILQSVPGLSWKCPSCVKDCILLNQLTLQNMLETHIIQAVSSFKDEVNLIKSDISKSSPSASVTQGPPKYSDVLKDRSQPAIIIRPKQNNHSLLQTKSDILRNLNPTTENLQLSKIKSIKDGGLLIGCRNQEDNKKIKNIIQTNLADTYSVREVTGVQPRLRVVGMTESYSEGELGDIILKSNSGIFLDDSECKVLKIFPTKKNPGIWQTVVQVDKLSYDRAVGSGNLFIGYDSCIVYDAIEVHRCYKCNEFNHSSRTCTKAITCPVCGDAHDVKQCKSAVKECSNCKKLSDPSIDISHAVWEREKCTSYTQAYKSLKNNLFITK